MPGYQVGTCIHNGDCTAGDWTRATGGTVLAVVGGVEAKGAGTAADFFVGSTYTSKVLGQIGNDLYHGFPMAIDSLAAEAGQVARIVGEDGAAYLSLRVDRAVNGVKGAFEYIKDSAGNINHRLFVPKQMKLPTSYIEIGDSLGICLDQINAGSREVAFPRNVALDALRKLDETSIAVLGGDVLRLSDGRLEYVYANWFCNRFEHEESRSYAERSRCEAASYVENFNGVDNFEPLFVFVLSEVT